MPFRELWAYVLRPSFAFAVASLVAGHFCILVWGDNWPPDRTLEVDFTILIIVSLTCAAFALIPTVLTVMAARIFCGPRPWSEITVGLLTGPASAVFLFEGWDHTIAAFAGLVVDPEFARFAVPGAIGGLVYWLVAGRPGARDAYEPDDEPAETETGEGP
ncbi:MAG: hypothetical protein ACFB6R_02225 [Alphaproteobacteria bacterium]